MKRFLLAFLILSISTLGITQSATAGGIPPSEECVSLYKKLEHLEDASDKNEKKFMQKFVKAGCLARNTFDNIPYTPFKKVCVESAGPMEDFFAAQQTAYNAAFKPFKKDYFSSLNVYNRLLSKKSLIQNKIFNIKHHVTKRKDKTGTYTTYVPRKKVNLKRITALKVKLAPVKKAAEAARKDFYSIKREADKATREYTVPVILVYLDLYTEGCLYVGIKKSVKEGPITKVFDKYRDFIGTSFGSAGMKVLLDQGSILSVTPWFFSGKSDIMSV